MRNWTLSIVALAAAQIMIGANDCQPQEPLATCEAVAYDLKADGTLTLTNNNAVAVATDINIEANVCTRQSCSYTGAYVQEILEAGETRVFVADQGGDVCSDVFCCATGYTGRSAATVYVYEGSCTLGIAATQPSCGVNATQDASIY